MLCSFINFSQIIFSVGRILRGYWGLKGFKMYSVYKDRCNTFDLPGVPLKMDATSFGLLHLLIMNKTDTCFPVQVVDGLMWKYQV